jgi:hypothetical protein
MRLPFISLSLFLALAAPAAADSIVYTKDANIWVARPDGSEARQITRDGGYQSPSQADDGTILAVRGDKLYKFDRQGHQLAAFGSVLTGKPGSIGAVGPFDARISPDGTKLAYWIGIMGGWYDYSTGTYYSDPESAINYQSAVDGSQLGSTMFYEEPSWLADSQHLLLWDSINGGVPQAVSGTVGMNHNQLTGWFHDLDVFNDPGGWKPTGAGELSRDGKRLAALRARATMGAGGHARGTWNSIQIYDVSSLTTPPTGACFIADETGKEFGPPSWSPGGDQIAFARPDGIYTSPVCGVAPKLVIAGGNEPDWGPADPGAAATPEPTPQPTVQPTPKAKLASAKLRGRTLKVTVSCPAACRADAVAKRGTKVVGRAKGRANRPGPLKLAMKVRGRGKLALTVKVRLGATTQTLSKTVR